MIRSLLIVTVICIFVTGCASQRPIVKMDPATPCEQIVPPFLLTVPFDDITQGQEQVEEWILTQFPTVTIDFEPSPTKGEGEVGWFFWSVDDKPFSIYFVDGRRYIFHRFERYPTLGQIFRCFGEPQYYTLGAAYIGGEAPSAVLLTLWYPERGLYFASETWGISEIRRYDINSPLAGEIRIMPPGTVEEMMKWGGLGTGYITEEDALLREWPDNFTELVLEE